MIYLNNAGTSWPKPNQVSLAMEEFMKSQPQDWDSIYESAHQSVCNFFNILDPHRFLITNGCTSSISIALSDFEWLPGDRIAISHMEHHALSRWYHKLQAERNVQGVTIPRSADGPLDLHILEEELKQGIRLVAISMAANVTGELLPFKEVIALAKKYNSTILLDGAQTAGIIPIDIAKLDPDFFVFAGHKGPLGPQGIGGLYIKEGVPMICPSAACEITPGTKPKTNFPGFCDTGSVNIMAAAGLAAGFHWVQDNQEENQTRRQMLVQQILDTLQSIPEITVFGSNRLKDRTAAIAFTALRKPPGEIAKALWQEFNIKAAHGFMCSPMAHEAIGTADEGVVRLSIGNFNTQEEIDLTSKALVHLLKH